MTSYYFIPFLIAFTFSCGSKEVRQTDQGYDKMIVSREESNTLKAGEIISRIKKNVTCPWRSETVDTYKSGDEESDVTGIATTFLATLDVLQRASAAGLNMVITHEPTYYNHLDDPAFFLDDPIYLAKKKFI
ncbi:MAG: Nif3-like dinuclear metal center hexameric protein, partial [Saprospiraceae bacterium]|nr:Nif3-like dinuclear metal center hexameric protein [Saprospiraceae bacterium]